MSPPFGDGGVDGRKALSNPPDSRLVGFLFYGKLLGMDSYVDSFINDVIAGLADETPSAGSFAEARQKAKEGDPMPLAHLQWPGAVWDEFQEDLVVKFFDPEIWACAVKGSTGCGKGATAARILCLYYDVFRDAKIILTSVSHEHCLTTLFNEVKLWFNRMSSRPPGLVGAMNIKDGEEHFILPVNPANETAFAGKHSQGGHTVFGFDEANAVLPDRWDNMQDQANKAIVLSNPRSAACRFRSMFPAVDPDKTQVILHSRGKIFCQTISAMDMCNYKKQCLSKPIGPLGGVTIEGKFFEHGEKIPSEYHRKRLPIIPGQRCYDEVQADLAAKDKRRVEWQVHAKFPKSDEDVQTILPEWRPRSDEAWITVHETLPVWVFGLDIAASADGDSTQLAAGGILGCKGLHGTHKADTTDTVAWVYKIAQEHYGIDLRRQGVVVGDAVGVGKGPLDLLASQGVDVLFLYGSGRPIIEESAHRFKNVRAEMYGLLGDRLNPDGAAHHETAFPLPPDELLWEELCAAEKIYDSMGKFKLTPKTESVIDQGSGRKIESIKDKIGRSPDRADAVTMMYLGALYKETEGGVVINRPLLLLPDDIIKKQKTENKPVVFNPNMPLWMNPTSVEIADILEKQQKAVRESEIATVDK